MRFQNTAYMTNGFSERIPAAQKLMILDGINNARLFTECDYLQVFKLMPTDHEGRRVQKIVHTQEQPPYEKEYILLTDEIVTEKVFVIDDETHHTFLLAEEY